MHFYFIFLTDNSITKPHKKIWRTSNTFFTQTIQVKNYITYLIYRKCPLLVVQY